MLAAIFALVGAALGVLGTLVTEVARGRTEQNRSHQEQLRNACADFTAATMTMRELAINVIYSRDTISWEQINDAVLDARVAYERLRLISTSVEVQSAGRHALRYNYGVVRQAAGKPARDDELETSPLILASEWQLRLYCAGRKELGILHAEKIYREPIEWLAPSEVRQPEVTKEQDLANPAVSAGDQGA